MEYAKLVVIDGCGRRKETPVYSVEFGCSSTPESARWMIKASGDRGHQPITVTAANPSSLFFSLLKSVLLPQVQIEFYRPAPSGSGTLEQFYTIILFDAVITSNGRRIVPVSFSKSVHLAEQIQIAFQRIEWAYVSGGVQSADDWSQQT